ncbi:MAG: tRNA (guanosine(46)-N7)-methyltransferase TrmB [Flavobacteriaceae bacterium]|nr:tRNA (guanosine(46)-N7)-methyltransferase TrmB [Flavobacteriaceae bacterium]
MGSKNKLRRFKENETFLNLIQPTREDLLSEFNLKGNWKDEFKNDNPIVLELGCGKGEYTLALAKEFPNINVIGIDIKGARLWRGAKTALETGLENIRFLRAQIELLPQVFDTSEISEIWITFPDPQIKYKRQKHRLVNLKFLNMYKALLKENGLIHLKTDSEFLHGYTLGLLQGLAKEIVYSNHDIYRLEGSPQIVTSVQTFYEKQYLESFKPITYLQFRL